MRSILIFLTALLAAMSLPAKAASLDLANDSATGGPGKIAAEEIRREAAARGDGTMTDAQQKEYLKKYEAEVISPEEAAKWTRGASNAGYHYLGCAKTFALMGKAFAEANLQMINR